MSIHRALARCAALAALLAALSACSSAGQATAGRSLRAYADEAELAQALERWRSESGRRRAERRQESLALQSAPAMPPPMPAAPAPAAAKAADAAQADGVTNVQTAGVDEGGIVKRAGDYLVVLRRGRLFTVRVGGDALQPVSMLDAYASDVDPRGAWYDELLVSGSTVVVVGYSYQRGGTEIGLFEIDARGGLTYRSTHHLRSFDYYSARNYASRLIGRQLVFYSPTLLWPWGQHPLQMMPGLRRWDGPAAPGADQGWRRILPATRIYRTDDDFDPSQPLALHTVTRCDLGGAGLDCASSAVLGPPGRVFYVSQGSVYVWTAQSRRAAPDAPAEARSAVFRIPLDGSAPTGIKTVGVPVDQLSFLEDAQGHLNVLLRAAGAGEGMWGANTLRGGTALLRLPLSALGDGSGAAQAGHYRRLPAARPTQNRYIGDWLLLGEQSPPPRRDAAGGDGPRAWAVRYADPDGRSWPLDPGHAVERIDALGAHAVLVGNAGRDLHFTAVRLSDRGAEIAGRHVQHGARQGETRSHGFYHLPTGADEGLLGLPVLAAGAPQAAGHRRGAAAVIFLRQRALHFQPLGALESHAPGIDDRCRASCVDWYGNARPLFVDARVFALLGYELVEGRLGGEGGAERIEERRRVSFAPAAAARDGGRHSPFTP